MKNEINIANNATHWKITLFFKYKTNKKLIKTWYSEYTHAKLQSNITHHQAPGPDMIPGLTWDWVCDSLGHFSPPLEKSKTSGSSWI